MIDYIKGTVSDLAPTVAIIECAGIGYTMNISLNTFTDIQGKKEVKLYVYESIREDAWILYGFASKKERDFFLLLLSVSGVGGNTARMVLSSFSVSELANIIEANNDRLLSTVKGLGKKTAQKIILELKDKIGSLEIESSEPGQSASALAQINREVHDEAVEALKMLGFSPAPTSKVVRSILTEDPDAPVEVVIKKALKML